MKKTYQVVIQWDESFVGSIDSLVDLEDMLIDSVSSEHEVDGHDMGAGQANIFLITENPLQAFEEIEMTFRNRSCWQYARVAYRDILSSHFVVLWPKNLADFQVR